MSSYLTSAKEQRLNRTPTPYLSSNSTMGESNKKLKGRVCESIEGEFGGQFSQLPKDIVLNILSRLQFKDLKQCRYVRKSWYQTIPSPHFSKLHHEKSASRGTYLVSYIFQDIIDSDSCDLYLLEFYYSTESGTYAFEVIPLKINFKDMDVEYRIVGSCNGLLCLCEALLADPVYICNPLIGEYITLPLSNDLIDETIISGFGFDLITGDYKVIRMTCLIVVLNDGDIRRDLEAEVYTLGSKNWRKIGAVPFLPCGGDPRGVFLNGVIHWMSDGWNIVCFDVASEKFSVVKVPHVHDNVETVGGSRYLDFRDVRVLKGHLCVVDYNISGLDVWVMKKYGDDQSWVKELLFDSFLLEVQIISVISQNFPLIRDFCPHVVSFVSHMNPIEEASGSCSGEEASLKLEEWTNALNPVAPGPRRNSREIVAAVEDGGVIDLEEEYGVVEEMENRPELAGLLTILRLLKL